MAFSWSASRGRVSLVLVVAAALLGGCGGDASSPAALNDSGFVSGSGAVTIITPAERGDPISLEGPLLGGSERLDLASLRGKVVLINIWGSWCAPCRKEAPELEAAWKKLKAHGVQFVGVNTRDDAAGAAEAFERRYKISYPSLRDPDGRLQLAFRKTLPPRAIPSTLVLDREGRVAARIVGASTMRTFVALIEDVLAETA
ncbi:TlpA family protein disulfide reductase [Sporichthya polymorpha]|uniref:TlpA family protein disulfide reductase n=1 Tax=Sporichthya polymorpha TaxID=35751 RepID=UPI0003A9BEE8|nr:TlpA disulfide reductase family protein [Sporichthya polymorpha]